MAQSPAAAEREVRTDLAAAYRLVNHFGWDDLAFTHISMRAPTQHDHFYINPFGMLFDQVTATNLIKIDHEGKFVEPSNHRVNQAGFVIHSALHMARKDVNCVLHTHTVAGVAFSSIEAKLEPFNQWSLMFKDKVAYHEYEGIALDTDERQRLVDDFGDNTVMILRNHGLLTTGSTVAEAFRRMYYLEKSCQVQLQVMASGAKIHWPETPVLDKTAGQYNRVRTHEEGGGSIEWPALRQMLDAKDPSYKN
jgi:ribulose-5-phosphate 4-epimerase/fuculose-1-phosphate aldolase